MIILKCMILVKKQHSIVAKFQALETDFLHLYLILPFALVMPS